MSRNLNRYIYAWTLRKQGKKLLEIAQIMGFKSGENARRMISFIDFKLSSDNPNAEKFKKRVI